LWGAYTSTFPAIPWFTGKTKLELCQNIDDALAAVPPPVY
jgi:hypothetical protein